MLSKQNKLIYNVKIWYSNMHPTWTQKKINFNLFWKMWNLKTLCKSMKIKAPAGLEPGTCRLALKW